MCSRSSVFRIAPGLLTAALVLSHAPAGAETILKSFPIVVHAGVSAGSDSSSGRLPDVPFRLDRGYGYVGGKARSLTPAALRDGFTGRVGWRDDPRKYSFHLPNGVYRMQLTFVETETAQKGVRVFDIQAEGEPFVTAVDIAREAGDFVPLTIDGLVALRDGWLDITFESRTVKPTKRKPGKKGTAQESLPPVISRIEIAPVSGLAAELLPAPLVTATPAFRANRIEWQCHSSTPIAGFGVFRSEWEDGPFVSLTDYPILGREFTDGNVRYGRTYYYRVRAYGAQGRQSGLSPVVDALSESRPPEGLKVYEINVADDDLGQLQTRKTPAKEVKGTLAYASRSDGIRISAETASPWWQFRKSYRARLKSGKRAHGRGAFRFLAEAGDPTLLREALFCEAGRKLGLAMPRTEPARLLINQRDEGVFLSRENIDRRFLRYHRLDRIGTLCRVDLRGGSRLTWRPSGEQIGGGGGGLSHLTRFQHELLRLHESEVEAFFDERFYVKRLLTRLAFAALVGRSPRQNEERLLLRDSRNGKWEYFTDRAPEGAFGVRFFEHPRSGSVADEEIAAALFGPSLFGAELPLRNWQLLETRLFNDPAVRRRYLERILGLAETFTPEVFAELVETLHQPLKSAIGKDVKLWPFDGGKTFSQGPGLLKEHFAAHREAALRAARGALHELAEPLVISEFLLTPSRTGARDSNSTGARKFVPYSRASLQGAWIEIWNRSQGVIDLGKYRLSVDPRRPNAWVLPKVRLAPDQRQVIRLGGGSGPFFSPLRPSPGGGTLILSTATRRGGARVADVVFFGHQTPGFSYGRTADGTWAFHAEPTPGKPSPVSGLEPPAWRFTWSQGFEKKYGQHTNSGDLTVSLKPGRPRSPGGSKVTEAFLCLRPSRHPDFDILPMKWSDERSRYEYTLSPARLQTRQSFFFLARAESGLERAYPLTGSDLTFFTPSRPKIFINEVLPRPSKRGEKSGEFVELYNAGDQPVSVEGMYLTDDSRNTVRWRIPERRPIPAKGFLVVYADGKGAGNHTNFKLANSGEYIGLFHRYEEGNVLVDHATFNALPVNQSWGRREDGKKGFRRWKDPTPGKKNLPKIPERYQKKGKKGKQGKRSAEKAELEKKPDDRNQ